MADHASVGIRARPRPRQRSGSPLHASRRRRHPRRSGASSFRASRRGGRPAAPGRQRARRTARPPGPVRRAGEFHRTSGVSMKAYIWLRCLAALLALFTIGHTLGTYSPKVVRGPAEAAMFQAMQSFRFPIMGFERTHWDFYRGFAITVSVLLAA